MVRKLDEILVVDIEATCWEGEPPAGQVSEIIEIGICVLQVATLETGPTRSLLIRPDRSTVSPYCTALTGHSQSEVETGMLLAAACDILAREYGSAARVWASYGDYDREQFQFECAAKDIPYPLGKTHINVKTWLAAARPGGKSRAWGKLSNVSTCPLKARHTVAAMTPRTSPGSWLTSSPAAETVVQTLDSMPSSSYTLQS